MFSFLVPGFPSRPVHHLPTPSSCALLGLCRNRHRFRPGQRRHTTSGLGTTATTGNSSTGRQTCKQALPPASCAPPPGHPRALDNTVWRYWRVPVNLAYPSCHYPAGHMRYTGSGIGPEPGSYTVQTSTSLPQTPRCSDLGLYPLQVGLFAEAVDWTESRQPVQQAVDKLGAADAKGQTVRERLVASHSKPEQIEQTRPPCGTRPVSATTRTLHDADEHHFLVVGLHSHAGQTRSHLFLGPGPIPNLRGKSTCLPWTGVFQQRSPSTLRSFRLG